MNEINIEEFKANAKKRDGLITELANLQIYFERIIEEFFIRNKGKYLVLKDHCCVSKYLPEYIKHTDIYSYLGKLNYVEDLPRGYDASGIPDTLITEIGSNVLIITNTYNGDDLEYGMYVYTRYTPGFGFYNETSYDTDQAIFRINYMDADIFDKIFLFDTEEEALLFMEVNE